MTLRTEYTVAPHLAFARAGGNIRRGVVGKGAMTSAYRLTRIFSMLSVVLFAWAPYPAIAETPGEIPKPWTYEGSMKLQEQQRQQDQQFQQQQQSPQGAPRMAPGGGGGGAAAAAADAARAKWQKQAPLPA